MLKSISAKGLLINETNRKHYTRHLITNGRNRVFWVEKVGNKVNMVEMVETLMKVTIIK